MKRKASDGLMAQKVLLSPMTLQRQERSEAKEAGRGGEWKGGEGSGAGRGEKWSLC